MDAAVSLIELLESLDDPRAARGKRHPLSALLALAVVALLAGQLGYEAIVQYGKERGWPFLQALGFTRRRGLCKATYSRVFRRIDVVAFEAAVAAWIGARIGPGDARHLALDGKSLRGSREGDTPAAHLVAAYAPDVEAVVGQIRVDATTNEHEAALELLGVLPLRGRVVTADAMFTHRDVCTAVLARGGDYILPAEDNQANLLGDIRATFAEPPAGLSPPADRAPGGELRAGAADGQGARPDRGPHAGGDDLAGRVPRRGLAGLRAGVPAGARASLRRRGRA